MSGAADPGPSLPKLILGLWRHTERRRRAHFWGLLTLMVATSFAEVVSIGAVFPFLGALTHAEVVYAHPAGKLIAGLLRLNSAQELILPLTIAFCAATLLAGTMRVALLWASTRFSFAIGSDLSNAVYCTTLYQPYSTHISRNSSEVINAVWNQVSEVIFYILIPLMAVIGSMVIMSVICIAMVLAIPKVALVAFACLGIAYAAFMRSVKRRLRRNSECITKESTRIVQVLQEGLGGIRDVIIDGSQATFTDVYRSVNLRLRRVQGENQIMSTAPRYVIEALGMLMIAMLAYLLSREPTGMDTAVPVLAATALGLQRLLPAAQQLYGGWSLLQGAHSSLRGVLAILADRKPVEARWVAPVPLAFNESIRLAGVGFRYAETGEPILTDIDLTIRKGARVGFVGPTGCGKTTLLDIVMGLLQPTHGDLWVDGERITSESRRSWQLHIAHVPQSIFLADSSIAENIAFGIPPVAIDVLRVQRVAQQAQLAELIEKWPEKYATRVGERGVQLSGGQRQRIGIARALYKNADLIILDEATSALDSDTEHEVMQAIEALDENITVLIIAHRLNTLAGCTEIVELNGGVIVARRSGSATATRPAASALA